MVLAASANPAYLIGEGPVDEGDLAGLIERLRSPDAIIRMEAADDLRRLGRKAASATAPLTELLGNPPQRVRLSAAAALLQINPKEARAVEVLARGLETPIGRATRRGQGRRLGRPRGREAGRQVGVLAERSR